MEPTPAVNGQPAPDITDPHPFKTPDEAIAAAKGVLTELMDQRDARRAEQRKNATADAKALAKCVELFQGMSDPGKGAALQWLREFYDNVYEYSSDDMQDLINGD